MASFISLVSKVSLAYSFKYIAAQTPIGSVIKIAQKTIERVPTIAGKIPPLLIPFVGIAVKNSKDMAEYPFFIIIKIIITTGIIATIVAQNKNATANF
jgi:hypothetical protein